MTASGMRMISGSAGTSISYSARETRFALRSRPYAAQLRDGHGLAGVELSAGRDGHINELARPQVMQYCFRVVGRTHKQFADHTDALRVQGMVVL